MCARASSGSRSAAALRAAWDGTIRPWGDLRTTMGSRHRRTEGLAQCDQSSASCAVTSGDPSPPTRPAPSEPACAAGGSGTPAGSAPAATTGQRHTYPRVVATRRLVVQSPLTLTICHSVYFTSTMSPPSFRMTTDLTRGRGLNDSALPQWLRGSRGTRAEGSGSRCPRGGRTPRGPRPVQWLRFLRRRDTDGCRMGRPLPAEVSRGGSLEVSRRCRRSPRRPRGAGSPDSGPGSRAFEGQ
jgi:hypothetical protein